MNNHGKPAGRHLIPHLLALIAYTALTLMLTYPLVLQLHTHLAGGDIDVWINPWANWWLEKAITEGLGPFHSDYLFYPEGVSLVFHSFSPVNTLFWWLLKPLFGAMVSYNLTILLAYVMSGYTMWLLARYWTGNDYAGFLAGVIFAFSPYHMMESAHPVIATTQWIPLSSLCLIKALRERSVQYGCLSAVFLILSALSGWHLLFFAGLWALLYIAYKGLFQRGLRTPGTLKPLLALALLAMLLLAPLLYPILREGVRNGISYMSAPQDTSVGNHPLAFFIPSERHPVLGELFSQANRSIGPNRERSAFVGYLVLLMGIHAAFKGKVRTRFWVLAFLTFTLLSLHSRIPLRTGKILKFPWSGPVVALFRHPFRFNILVSFSLSMLVACDFAELLRSGPLQHGGRAAKVLVTGSLTVLILFEYLILPFPTTHPDPSPFYHSLREMKQSFAIVEIPIGRQPDKLSMYYQTIHEKKLVGGVVSRTPTDAYDYIAQDPLLCAAGRGKPSGLSHSDISQSFKRLAGDDVRYVTLKKGLMEKSTLRIWRSLLKGSKIYEDDKLVVYTTAHFAEE